MLDILVPEVRLQCSRVMPFIRERITAGVPEHVRVRLERKFRLYASPLDHTSEPGGAKGCATLRGKHKG
jgi:hypothetical protein